MMFYSVNTFESSHISSEQSAFVKRALRSIIQAKYIKGMRVEKRGVCRCGD